jgi:hypothetical protein
MRFGVVLLTLALSASPLAAQTCPPSDLNHCPAEGCTTEGPAHDHPLLNKRKNTQPDITGDPHTLTFADFKKLQAHVATVLHLPMGFGTDLTTAQRKQLEMIPLPSGSTGEGAYVQIAAFIAQPGNQKSPNPHANSKESTNCDLTGVENNDFHISIAPHDDDDEFAGIVVEMIPRDRNPKWTLDKLDSVREAGRRVLVQGQLMFDNLHKIRRTFEENKSGNPPRVSIWEVHPVTELKVCMRMTNTCHANTAGGWVNLADVDVADLQKFIEQP